MRVQAKLKVNLLRPWIFVQRHNGMGIIEAPLGHRTSSYS